MGIQAIGSNPMAVDLTNLLKSQSTNADAETKKAGQSAPQKAGGAPPAGGGSAKPAASTESTTSTSSALVYDKRDADKDGVVSYKEELAYTFKHPNDETQKQEDVSATQLQTGLNAYQQGQQSQQANSTAATSRLLAI